MENVNITLLQQDLVWENPQANRQRAEALLASQQHDPDIIILAEMFATGFTMNPAANAEKMEGDSVSWMAALAKTYDALVMGSLVIEEGGNFYNRMVAMGPDGVVATYDKRHAFRMAGEHTHYQTGNKRVIFTYKGWRICPQICYDLRFPAWSRAQSDETGPDYDLLIYVANWPSARIKHWETLLEARAIENQAYAIGVNRVGKDSNGYQYSGGSMVVDPHGNRQVHNIGSEIALETSLDPNVVQDWRAKFPIWMDGDVVDILPQRRRDAKGDAKII